LVGDGETSKYNVEQLQEIDGQVRDILELIQDAKCECDHAPE